MPGTGDPKLDAMLAASPDQTPSSLYPLLHGQRTQDINLAPQESLTQILLRKLGLGPLTNQAPGSSLMQTMVNRDQKMMDAKPKPGTYPIAIDKYQVPARSDDVMHDPNDPNQMTERDRLYAIDQDWKTRDNPALRK